MLKQGPYANAWAAIEVLVQVWERRRHYCGVDSQQRSNFERPVVQHCGFSKVLLSVLCNTPNAPEAIKLRIDDALQTAAAAVGAVQTRATPLRQPILEHSGRYVLPK